MFFIFHSYLHQKESPPSRSLAQRSASGTQILFCWRLSPLLYIKNRKPEAIQFQFAYLQYLREIERKRSYGWRGGRTNSRDDTNMGCGHCLLHFDIVINYNWAFAASFSQGTFMQLMQELITHYNAYKFFSSLLVCGFVVFQQEKEESTHTGSRQDQIRWIAMIVVINSWVIYWFPSINPLFCRTDAIRFHVIVANCERKAYSKYLHPNERWRNFSSLWQLVFQWEWGRN